MALAEIGRRAKSVLVPVYIEYTARRLVGEGVEAGGAGGLGERGARFAPGEEGCLFLA